MPACMGQVSRSPAPTTSGNRSTGAGVRASSCVFFTSATVSAPSCVPTTERLGEAHKRAAALYHAAFKLDPGKNGRMLTAWLRKGQAVPMQEGRRIAV